MKVIVVGGGIAGVATAHALATLGARVELLEQEPLLGSQSTGKSAAVFRCLDLSVEGAALALRSAVLLDELFGARDAWLRPCGLLYLASDPERLRPLEVLAERHGLRHRTIAPTGLPSFLEDSEANSALECLDEGVVDVHAVMQALHGRAKALGVRFHQNAKVSRVLVTANHAGGVELGDGTAMAADAVVLAAGARARALGEGANAPLPLAPKGRHLVLLECDPPPIRLDRVVWRIDDEVYFRAESGGVLASPCDELEHSASLEVQQQSLVMLAEKLRRTAPSLRHARVRHAWVGLRTFAPDRAMVIGADPRVGGLFWLAGLGGHGISAGVAASELVARAIVVGEAPPEPLLPNRLLAGLERSSRGEGG